MQKNYKVHMISLGCARNRVDSEVMLGQFFNKNWSISDNPKFSDAVIINTCSFIEAAKTESIDIILEMTEHKQHNPELKVVVAGCLSQRYKHQLVKSLPEVDLFIGTDEFVKVAELLEAKLSPTQTTKNKVFTKRTNYLYDGGMPRVNTMSKSVAYVKVAEGCQHSCSFCIIPAIRGPLRSRYIPDILQEVKSLIDKGVLEINLIAQDLAAYGRDADQGDLIVLLKALVGVNGLQRLRCLYMYPENISNEFLQLMRDEPKIVKYLDIPIQHASDSILKAMGRPISRNQLVKTIKKVRSFIPNIALRTSVMVGFPGETIADFEQLKTFVLEQKFAHLGCFTYSKEEGTRAARMEEQVKQNIMLERQQEIMLIQQKISADNLKKYVGQELEVLFEEVNSKESNYKWQGRLATQAPEVDGFVLSNNPKIKPHMIQSVKITSSIDYDLISHP